MGEHSGTPCPAITFSSKSKTWDTSALPCESDETCACADPSFVREMVNVTVDGLACYACEPRRPPACTEAMDQCTPEACECADPTTHVKHSAATMDGSPCHFCEPINGYSAGFGMSELMIVVMLALLVLTCHFMGRRQPRGARGSLRLARRKGDRTRAIRVQQEPLCIYEEVLLTLGDALDMVVDGACDLVSAAVSSVASTLGHVLAFFCSHAAKG
mmetsp:Transcript_19149/g.45121  ORF Transcript_19149/g.45121 Transcript_19149/m.45121 type:complete len:216 (-) Transcript_19149:150-797(-)